MKKAIILFVALFCAAGLLAQTSKLPTVIDIVSVEDENTGDSIWTPFTSSTSRLERKSPARNTHGGSGF